MCIVPNMYILVKYVEVVIKSVLKTQYILCAVSSSANVV